MRQNDVYWDARVVGSTKPRPPCLQGRPSISRSSVPTCRPVMAGMNFHANACDSATGVSASTLASSHCTVRTVPVASSCTVAVWLSVAVDSSGWGGEGMAELLQRSFFDGRQLQHFRAALVQSHVTQVPQPLPRQHWRLCTKDVSCERGTRNQG